jgi:hypothetical protein
VRFHVLTWDYGERVGFKVFPPAVDSLYAQYVAQRVANEWAGARCRVRLTVMNLPVERVMDARGCLFVQNRPSNPVLDAAAGRECGPIEQSLVVEVLLDVSHGGNR